MPTYELVLESGPRRKKTYVHVPELLGCMARGDTTEEALEAAPDAIRDYLRFLQRHGEAVDPEQDFDIEVGQHITEGYFLGNGTMLIEADHVPLSAEEVDRYARWLDWVGEELSARLAALSTLDDDPERGRSIRAILQHVIGAECAYLSATFGSDRACNALVKESEAEGADLADVLARLGALSGPRLRAMTPDERALSRQAGQQLWTARKMVRRMLEHRWEHLREIEDRVAAATGK